MLKYATTDVVFQEIPGEVTLAINITACPCRCPGCHSKYLWADSGRTLDEHALDALICEFGDEITCVAFMGGDGDPSSVNRLAEHTRRSHPKLRTAWYTGRTIISSAIIRTNFAYIKVGPYIKHLGPLDKPTTNQRMYRIHSTGELEDITALFWKKKP